MWEAHNWPRSVRIGIGVYTFVGVAVGLVVFASLVLWPDEGLSHVIRPDAASLLYLTMPIMILLMIALFAPAAFANPRLDRSTRVLWLAGFAVAGIFVLPLYWWLHVMRAPYGPVDDASPEAEPKFWLRPKA